MLVSDLPFIKYAAILVNMFYFKRTLGLIVGTGLVCITATPAYGIEFHQSNQAEVQEVKTDSRDKVQTIEIVSVVQPLAQRSEVTVVEASVAVEPVRTQPISTSLPGNQGLLGAALAQIGWAEDCTALVENALRAIGHQVPDVGPMQFMQYGVQVDASQIQPGDIMIRSGHVAIYAGNGTAVHGGFGGRVVLTSTDSDPYSYHAIIRIG